MSRLFYHTMQDNLGNLLFDVSGTMRIAGSGTLATIYGDEGLTVILPNPMTNHPSYGSFKCYLPSGDFDFYMAKAGYSFETLTGVQGWGTMADQDASAVAITGGTASFSTLGIGIGPLAGSPVFIRHAKAGSSHGITLQPSDADTGTAVEILFINLTGAVVGSITSNASATAYNTTSDSRLKTMVEMFDGALDLVRQLNPVRFRWRADDSEGQGFLASEVQQVVSGVVTGEPDAMNEDGSISPQQIDHSKLVPLLTAAVKELSAQVQALTARVHEMEAAAAAP